MHHVVAGPGRRYKTVVHFHPAAIAASPAASGASAEPHDDWCDSVVDWSSDIDQHRQFVCPTLTPLFYSPVYSELNAAQQLRYNQLSAISFVDLILFFEQSFSAALESLLRERDRHSASFQAEIEHFRDDERRHCQLWRKLNRLSMPQPQNANGYRIIRVGGALRLLLGFLSARPRPFPVAALMMLTLEEHSIEISRRCARVEENVLEPHYRDAFRAHLLDEARHVQIDRTILRELLKPLSGSARRLNATLFQMFIRKLWLRPANAAASVVEVLVDEFPELRPTRSRLLAGLGEAGNNPEYRRMMFSPKCTPLLFGLLRLHPEFCPAEIRDEFQIFGEGQLT
jgi:hypothetical protein